MKKAVISVFLVLTLVVNVFGFGVLSSRASAAAVFDDAIIIGFIASCIAGVCGGLASGYGESLDTYFSNHYGEYMQNIVDSINEGQIGELFNLYYNGTNSEFRPVGGISGDDLEFATFMCNYLNEHSSTAIDAYINSYAPDPALAWFGLDGIKRQISSSLYSQLKTDAVNAFTAYIECKRFSVDLSNSETAMDNLAEALGVEWDPTYQFDLVGPVSPVQMSDVTTIHGIDLDGVHFFTPILLTYTEANGWPTQATIQALGGRVSMAMSNGYLGYKDVTPGYGGSCYVIYYNDIYFDSYLSHRRDPVTTDNIHIKIPGENTVGNFVNLSGESLYSKINSINDLIGNAYFGVYAWTSSGNPSEYRPVLSSIPTNNDFTTTSGGGSVTIPKTDAENAVGQAITLGIVSDDPDIVLNDDGSIASVDGISLATLENLVQELIDKTYDFSSFEEYLNTIVALLQANNVNTDQIDDVISALRAWEANQEDALDTINTSIATAAATITAALEISGEGELDLPDINADGFIVTHTGLVEATTIANSIPIVNQVSQLLGNLFDDSQYDHSPPNFHFYYDSDGDGTDELYNAFDLSFLETDLSNNTLQDNELFDNSMTIRQFLQYLMIFLCYVAFAIRIIKKLPSLFGSAESFNEFTSEINK